jgi:CRISPR-associated endoribonuclease Cas6
MRLLIRLRCIEDSKYEMQYHYHLQGFIYNLLKGSKYDYVHDKDGYKFFCFSNIFPASPLVLGDYRTLIISSPDSEFVSYVHEVLRKPWNVEVKVGHMRFRIDSFETLLPKIPDRSPVSLITGTPIMIRIPKERYQLYDIRPSKEYDYVYWRSEYPLHLFVSQIESNLLKKYGEYLQLNNHSNHKENNKLTDLLEPSTPLFHKFKFKKQISTKLVMKGFEQTVIGTVWEFGFHPYTEKEKELVQFALDAGLGERNSLGFGFMNITSTSSFKVLCQI